MKKLFPLVLVLCAGFCEAQTRNPALDIKRTNIWRFGTTSTGVANDLPGLDFSSGTPVVINSGTSFNTQGATTVSDDNGNLQ